MSCCNPPLTAVPDGLWFCSRCQSEEGFSMRIHVKKVPQQKKKLIRQRPAPAVTARTVTAKAVTAAGVTAAVAVTATATVASATVAGANKNSRSKKRKADTPTTTTSTTTTLPKAVVNGTSSNGGTIAVAAPIRLIISHNNGTATGATTSSMSSKSVPEVRAHSARIRACNMNNMNNSNHNSSNGSSSSRTCGSSTRSTNRFGTASSNATFDNSRISHVLETGGHFNKRPKRAPVCDTDTGNSSSSSSGAANGNGYSNHNGHSNGKCHCTSYLNSLPSAIMTMFEVVRYQHSCAFQSCCMSYLCSQCSDCQLCLSNRDACMLTSYDLFYIALHANTLQVLIVQRNTVWIKYRS
jgi:hypothetical protein